MTGSPHVLVTGGAGAIGGAFARAYRAKHPDARVTLADLDGDGADRAARSLGGDARGERWDLSQPDTLPPLFEALVAARGPVDVLVNAAGIMELRSFAATDWALAVRLLRVDLESPLLLMSLAIPAMRARRRGLIVNVSSMAGVTPLRGSAFYGAAKAGLAMASEIARLELAPSGVHVVTVLPGPVRSPLERRARAQVPATAIARLLPTGNADALARAMVDACEGRKARVVYPGLYRLADRFPVIAALVTSALSPAPLDA